MKLRKEVTEVQEEALSAWDKAGKWGTVILPTGVGKSWLGVMAYRSFGEPPKTLVITSRIPIVHQWKKLIDEELGIDAKIDYLCIQSAYKYSAEYDFVIIDEVHRALSPEYRKVFETVKAKHLLCLTATLPDEEEYVEFLGVVAPVVYAKHLMEVVERGILPKFNIYNLEVPLAKNLTGKYKVFDNAFNVALIKLNKIKAQSPHLSYKYSNVFDIARNEQYNKEDKALRQVCKQYWSGMSMRRLVVYNNTAKIPITKILIDRFSPHRKWLLLTKSIQFAELLQQAVGGKVYHSKLHKKIREEVLEDFREGKFNLLIGVDALNEGVNLPDLDGVICLSGVSTELTNVQSIGRMLRFKEGKRKPIFINLYTKDTVEKNWVEQKTTHSGLKSVTKWVTNINQIQD